MLGEVRLSPLCRPERCLWLRMTMRGCKVPEEGSPQLFPINDGPIGETLVSEHGLFPQHGREQPVLDGALNATVNELSVDIFYMLVRIGGSSKPLASRVAMMSKDSGPWGSSSLLELRKWEGDVRFRRSWWGNGLLDRPLGGVRRSPARGFSFLFLNARELALVGRNAVALHGSRGFLLSLS